MVLRTWSGPEPCHRCRWASFYTFLPWIIVSGRQSPKSEFCCRAQGENGTLREINTFSWFLTAADDHLRPHTGTGYQKRMRPREHRHHANTAAADALVQAFSHMHTLKAHGCDFLLFLKIKNITVSFQDLWKDLLLPCRIHSSAVDWSTTQVKPHFDVLASNPTDTNH